MSKVWSFNTTVRNPERVQNFLRTLKELEGKVFDEGVQAEFFALQIKRRLYKPEKATLKSPELIRAIYDNADDIPDEVIDRVISLYDKKKDADAAMRGRTTAGILNRFGLCIALKSKGAIVITPLGNKYINNEIDEQDVFFRFLLKWQYPNPIESGYQDFNIKPFIS